MNARPLTILQVLPKLDTGGAERVVIEISEAIAASGHTPLIACAPGGALDHAASRAGAELVALPLDTKNPLKIRANAGRLRKLVKERNVALVHAHSRGPAWSAYWATRQTKTPFVTTYHGAYGEKSRLKNRYNSVMARGDAVIAVSGFIAGLIRARYGIPEDRLHIIPGGVDVEKFSPATVLGDRIARLAREWRLEIGQPTLLLPGRLTFWKGQKLLISALAKLRHRDAVAVLLGSDQGRENYTRNLVSFAQGLGVADRLRIAGHTEDMPAAMLLADVVVNASTEPEAFGRTIIEAQAMGRLTVAAAHGGAAETIVPEKTGFLFAPGDVDALAAAIDTALDMPPLLRIAFGGAARAHAAENFSVAAMQNKVLDVYASLLAR